MRDGVPVSRDTKVERPVDRGPDDPRSTPSSGLDPMDRNPISADAAHAMTTALRYLKRAGRFGRDVRCDDVQMADARTTMQMDGAEAWAGYEIDPDAVATAIVSRLIAGRTLPAPPAAER